MNVDGNEYFINSDFFDSIIAARDALAINDTTALASAQTRVDDAANKLMESLTTVGVRLNSLETSIERMDQSNIDMQSLFLKTRKSTWQKSILRFQIRKWFIDQCFRLAAGQIHF
jgi:flagellin-like hook-associated protein FlgL